MRRALDPLLLVALGSCGDSGDGVVDPRSTERDERSCADADGDRVCDSNDVCPLGDDLVDESGSRTRAMNARMTPRTTPTLTVAAGHALALVHREREAHLWLRSQSNLWLSFEGSREGEVEMQPEQVAELICKRAFVTAV